MTTANELLRAIAAHCDAGGTLYGSSPLLEAARGIVTDADPRPRLPLRVGLTDEDRARRRQSLGASEVASVVGVHPYQSAHQVWASKCLGVDFAGNEATRLGQALESAILAIYSDRYGRTLRPGAYMVGPEPWISATPDAHVVEPVEEGLVEAKLVGLRSMYMWGPGNTDEEESDAIPLHYLCQAHWQLLVTGQPWVDVSALLGTEFRTYRIRRDAEIERQLVDRCRDFWFDYVVPKKEPAADGSAGCADMLRRLYPRSGAEPVQADAELEALVAKLAEARAAIDAAEVAKRLRENEIKARLMDARGAHGDGWRIRYATQKNGKRPFVFEIDNDVAAQ
jgi:putative phage-type endonuclease